MAKVLQLYDDDKCIAVPVAVLIMPAGRDDRLLLTAPRHASLHLGDEFGTDGRMDGRSLTIPRAA